MLMTRRTSVASLSDTEDEAGPKVSHWGLCSPVVNVLRTPVGVNSKMSVPAAAKRVPLVSKAKPTLGSGNPEAKTLFVPAGVNSRIVPESETKRLPALLNASPAGPANPKPVAKVVLVPDGVNS